MSKITHAAPQLHLVVAKELAPLLEQARRHQRAGNLELAEKLYDEILSRDPRCAAAWFFRGDLAMMAKDCERAVDFLQRALQCEPNIAAFHCDLGEAYRQLGRLEAAAIALRRALAIDGSFAEAHRNLGIVLEQQRHSTEAILSYETALKLEPSLAGCASRLVSLLRASGQIEHAIAAFKSYSKKSPQAVDLWVAGGNALADVYRLDEALLQYQKALEIAPESARAHAALGRSLAELGQIDAAISHLRKATELEPRHAMHHGALVYLLPYHPDSNARTIVQEAKAYGLRHTSSIVKRDSHPNIRDSQRRLRVGYVSADFRRHVEAHFTLPLFAHHDRSRFEIFAYSNVRHPDETSARLRSLVDNWCDISPLSDQAAADRIHADQIDVLVDLTMHTGHSRPLLFARKPAPVQVCWLAYPGTTGIEAIDYRITDVHLDPPGLHDEDYTERSVRLPDSFWCYDPLDNVAVSELPALARGHVTFGCLNNFRKVSPQAIELWARVIKAVPQSRFRMVAPLGKTRSRVRKLFEQGGVDPARIEFAGYVPRELYLEQYHQIDCCLDTVPYNGGTTSLDAFWMGVPVVTWVGQIVTGRSGKSLACNLGMPELATTSPDEYVERAVELTSDLERLAELRSGLRLRMEKSPLMNADRFAQNLEATYQEMWSRWCTQLSSS